MQQQAKINASVTPKGSLEVLSQQEVENLKNLGENGLYPLFRQCALAILNTGSDSDDTKNIMQAYKDFHIEIIQQDRGIRLNLVNAPANAFVDGKMIASSRQMLFSAMRDIIYIHTSANQSVLTEESNLGLTDYVFHFLRNADVLHYGNQPNMVVCWGGHSISEEEYQYSKEVGHSLGLRGLHICTGSGPGIMKGPMKGAAIAHAKQRIPQSRFLGLTEPGIITAEAPNSIVNELVILPDIEKRLESFVRVGHGIIIFPGGVGTAEELLFILGVLLDPRNQQIPFPLILTGPKSSEAYFKQLHEFIGKTLGVTAQQKYRIMIDQPEQVARLMKQGIDEVRTYRKQFNDAYYFNWSIKIPEVYQRPFEPTHENMSSIELNKNTPIHQLAANLRQAFSGIVAGNVKASGINLIEKYGPYEINGDKSILQPLDDLLTAFVTQKRMKLPGSHYEPCYRLSKSSG